MLHKKGMNKKLISFIIIFVLALAIAFAFAFKNNSKDITNSDSQSPSSNSQLQQITLSYKNYNYYPQEIRVKAGQPVRINLDSSVRGCYRSFTIKALGINKYLQTTSDYVEFTPTEKGQYTFACGMGMGTGRLIIE